MMNPLRFSFKGKYTNIFRYAVVAGIGGYLGYDFFVKEKYLLLVLLFLGISAFFVAIRRASDK
jgi:hypothetical protein